ncbi:MAG TPA: aspartate carbamoyltransferase [Candidatus Nanoarchaeia archaeon]|nr:aspartate carbamoyltransferase [Candidatus Nanoarchaeia archaeon]
MSTEYSKHVISSAQFFDKPILAKLFESADRMRVSDHQKQLSGKVLASLFYEPSTRTRFSFEAAMQRLGGSVISTEAAAIFSSVTKGESLEDTIKVTAGYADVIVLRHPEVGSAERAAAVSTVPVVNAGDGLGQHPTQALLDIYTIQHELGRVDGLTVALVGDLLNGRTIHSLLFLLGLYKVAKVYLVAPAKLQLPVEYRDYLHKVGVEFEDRDSLDFLDKSVDVVYMTRVQKERFESASEYEKLKDYFVLDKKVMARLNDKAIIMHPLPRVNEIATEVDDDPRAAYFRQAENGLYVRMALLEHLLAA